MNAARTIACLALLAGVCLLPTTASAQWPLYGSPYLGVGGFGGAGLWGPWNGTLSSAAYSPPPPYFSIHPPVYYSGVIARRSYGWSPYAYGPYAPQRAVSYEPAEYEPQPEPLLIVNPHVKMADDLPPPPAE